MPTGQRSADRQPDQLAEKRVSTTGPPGPCEAGRQAPEERPGRCQTGRAGACRGADPIPQSLAVERCAGRVNERAPRRNGRASARAAGREGAGPSDPRFERFDSPPRGLTPISPNRKDGLRSAPGVSLNQGTQRTARTNDLARGGGCDLPIDWLRGAQSRGMLSFEGR